jgi:hypothetical protein
MMSIGNFIAATLLLVSLVIGILVSNFQALTKAELYDNGILQAPYTEQLDLQLDIRAAINEQKSINKRIAGICHHDYETITDQTQPAYFDVFTQLFPGDGKMTARFELDIYNIYDCESGGLLDSVVEAAQFNIDQLQNAGYDVRIWFTEMPLCLGQQVPQIIADAIPDLLDLLRPHVMPSKDPEVFQQVIEMIVRAFTIERQEVGKQPVTLFEGWNEIESPGYFFGTRDLLVDNIMVPMIRGVEQVESELGYVLHFASHSTANGAEGFTPQVNNQIQQKILARGYDVDWINWHWYGTFPFHNTAPGGLDVLYQPILRSNPFATPKDMYDQVVTMKDLFPDKQLMISEWNAGAGGISEVYDYKAAAYVAGALIETHHAGLDDANHFLLKASDGFLNNLDLLNPTGHALKFFHQLGDHEVYINGISAGDRSHDVSAIASYGPGGITIMVSRFFGFGVDDERKTTLNFKLDGLDALIPSDEYGFVIEWINSEVFPGDETVDTIFNLPVKNGSLDFSIDLPAHTTALIHIDSSSTGGIPTHVQLDEPGGLELTIYPNPTSSFATVRHNLPGKTEITLYNEVGQQVVRIPYAQYEERIPEMPPGVYFVVIENGRESMSRKVVYN